MQWKGTWKILISVILLAYLVWKIELGEIIGIFSNTSLLLVLLSLPLFFLLHLIRALKWNVALRAVGCNIALLESLKVITIGTFYGMVTPGKAGEISRVYFLKEQKPRTVPTVIWDKAIDIGSLIVLSIFSVLLFFKNVHLIYLTLSIILLLIIFFFLAMNKKSIGFLAKVFKIGEKDKKAYLENMMKLTGNKRAILKIFLWSLIFYMASIATAVFILRSLSPDASLLLVFSLPLIILFGNAPITISGLGLREGVAALSFTILGERASLGFSFSLLWFLIMTAIPGIVGYFLTLRK